MQPGCHGRQPLEPLLLLVGALLAAGRPVVEQIVPARGSTLGGDQLLLRGTGFAKAGLCRFGWNWAGWAVNSTTAPYPTAIPQTRARLINSSWLGCVTPRVDFGGYVSVDVSVDGGQTWSGHDEHDRPLFQFAPPWSATVCRRPYVHEQTGSLLLRLDPLLIPPGELSLVGWFAGKVLVLARPVPAPDQHGLASIEFSLAELPNRASGELIVSVQHSMIQSWGSNQSVKFARAADAGATQPLVVVDYTRSALEVDGAPFLGFGWFTSSLYMTVAQHAVQFLIGEIERFASYGSINMILPYNLAAAPEEARNRVLDAAEAVGVKIIIDLHIFTKPIVGGTGPDGKPRPPPNNSSALWFTYGCIKVRYAPESKKSIRELNRGSRLDEELLEATGSGILCNHSVPALYDEQF